jgi:hypothetical protein
MTHVIPIFKKESRTDGVNCSPVLITSVPCKDMESFINNKMLAFLNNHIVIMESQHGFAVMPKKPVGIT